MDSREEPDWEGCYAPREIPSSRIQSAVADLAKILPNSGKPVFGRAPRNDYLLLSPGFKSGMKAYRVADAFETQVCP
jgi:hypothetical protein